MNWHHAFLKAKVKLRLCLTEYHAMKAYWESGGIAPRILNLGELSASCRGRFISGEISPGTHWIGGWVDRRAGLDAVAKIKNTMIAPVGN
jgi:hypothetical protein